MGDSKTATFRFSSFLVDFLSYVLLGALFLNNTDGCLCSRLFEKAKFLRGKHLGVDASTTGIGHTAMRNILVRRDTGEGDKDMLNWLMQESGIETPTRQSGLIYVSCCSNQ